MALGFDYTLSPDEQSSWKSFEDFAKKVSDKGINVPLTFGGGSGGNNPGGQPKLALEKQIKEIQNQLNKTLDGLSIKSAKLDLNDIIPIQEYREQINKLADLNLPLADIRHEGKLIKQQIQEWTAVASNFTMELDKITDASDTLKEKIEATADIRLDRALKEEERQAEELLRKQEELARKEEERQQKALAKAEEKAKKEQALAEETARKEAILAEANAKKVALIQENLFNQLNKLTLKTDGNLLDGLIPVDTLTQQINSLGQAGESTQSLNLRVKELRTELQQYGIVQNNIEAIMEDMIQNNGKLSDSFKLQGDIINKVTDAYENYADVKKNADNAQKDIQDKIQLIKTSKEYQSATEREKLRIDELCDSLKILAFSEKSVDDQKKEFIQTLDREKDLLDARYIDEARRKYDDLEGTIKNLVVRYVSLQAILHNVKAYFQDVMQYTKDLDDAYTDVAISMDITRDEFNAWTQDARQIAQANGQTTTSLMEMVKIYAQAGEDISDVQDKLAGTAMIQNITQWDAEQATSAVNSIINQYKLMDREINGVVGDTANAIQYIGDNLIGISNALSIDNVKGIQEMVSAIDDAGAVVNSAGGSMEWYMGVTGALAETMNATGKCNPPCL